ncbi:MAG TPA: mandelate racemase/muconate lactonizing enzyme family protein [Candidatus Dormibacteraeota bacterium]|nr:mandelate racemase/muconate lactonizing enzyme family protein [Candidatus Dormibacteraeota bacterium]
MIPSPLPGLAPVRIGAARLVRVRVPYTAALGGSFGPSYQGVLLALEGQGPEGRLTGWGEAPALSARGMSAAAVEAALARAVGALAGVSVGGVMDVEARLEALEDAEPHPSPAGEAGTSRQAEAPAALPAPSRNALETALLDLLGRANGLSLADLLGGRRRDTVECNALVLGQRPEAVAVEVAGLRARGFTTVKLKASPLWHADPAIAVRFELERLAAARWSGGPGLRLRLDLNCLDSDLAELAVASLAREGLEVLEQPLPATAGLAEWAGLAAWSASPLAADESLADRDLAPRLPDAGVGLAIKLATVGGPLAALRLARAAAAARRPVPVLLSTSMETAVGVAAAVQVAAAMEPPPLACGLDTLRFHRAAEGQGGGRGEARSGGLDWSGAHVEVPGGPGLGMAPSGADIARWTARD